MKDFIEAYNDMKVDTNMLTIMCSCGEIYFCGTFGEYSPGVFTCITPNSVCKRVSLNKINSEIESHVCHCGEILICSYYDEESNKEPDHFYGENITIL